MSAKRRREVPGGTVGGRMPWAKMPRSSSASQASIARRGSPSRTRSGTMCDGGPAGPRRGVEVAAVLGERGDASAAVGGGEPVDRGVRRGHDRDGQRGGEDEAARALREQVDERAPRPPRRRRSSRAPCRACRCAGRPGASSSTMPVAWASSIASSASCSRAIAASSAMGARSPSMLKTESLTIRRRRPGSRASAGAQGVEVRVRVDDRRARVRAGSRR